MVYPVISKHESNEHFFLTSGSACFPELLLPRGHPADAETATMSSAPLKSVSAPVNDPTPVKNDNGVPSGQEGQGKKCLLKWNGTKKINRIYGDWIDDLPLYLPNSKVES